VALITASLSLCGSRLTLTEARLASQSGIRPHRGDAVEQVECVIARGRAVSFDLAFDLFDRIAAMWSDVRLAREPSLG